MTGKLLARDVSAYLATEIERHGKAVLPGLGTLKLVERAAMRIRHPATRELYLIPARPALVFRRAKPRKAE